MLIGFLSRSGSSLFKTRNIRCGWKIWASERTIVGDLEKEISAVLKHLQLFLYDDFTSRFFQH